MALTGVNVLEFAGLAPGPFAGLVLADNGASVIRIDRPSATAPFDVLCRGKRSIVVDSKTPSGLALLRKLMTNADVVIDPFRPGVMERLGLGPELFLGNGSENRGLNERLIYARIVGFPRAGPYKDMAGHDLNYLALTGVLSMLPGASEKPTFPLNILADFAGGGFACAMGILLALIARGKSGRGQVVDTDMVSGARYISSFPLMHSLAPSPLFSALRGQNVLDGGAPFYDVYVCGDKGWISVACLEPQFFAVFLRTLLKALPNDFSLGWVPEPQSQANRDTWPQMRNFLERAFKTKTRDAWAKIFHGTDACVVPVLTPVEAAKLDPSHSMQPAPHPRISDVAFTTSTPKMIVPGKDTQEILTELGLHDAERQRLALDGAFGKDAQADAQNKSKL